ncbi:MAG: right-handed parallel beta-helix repeat-containing protein [Solirubrobacterales bacterium]
MRAAFAVATLAGLASPDAAPATDPGKGRCDRVATVGASPRAFVDSLRRGETGCLAPGLYRANRRDIKFTRPRVALTSLRRRKPARLVGRIWITRRADRVSIRNLNLNGANARGLPSPTVTANRVRLEGNRIRNLSSSCVILGDDDYGDAVGTVIERNRIHDCGRLPATNHDHGIYVAHADRTVIRGNWIYSNADRGVQLYPDADGSVITGNVIDGNGEGVLFAGSGDLSSDRNLVARNAITNSILRHNVEDHWQGPIGTDNVVRRNCLFGGARGDQDGGLETPALGYSAFGNVIANPHYYDRNGADFRLRDRSPCSRLLQR